MTPLDYRPLLPQQLRLSLCAEEDAQANMDADDVIGQRVAALIHPPVVRVWSGGSRAGIGVTRKDVQSAAGQRARRALAEAGYAVTVRGTGGTAVPAGPGVLHVSLILPRLPVSATTDAYYRLLCDAIVTWLGGYGLQTTVGPLPGSYCDGNYNVLVAGRKLVGTAQAWRGGLAGLASARPGYILAHAVVPVAVHLEQACQLINRFYALSNADYRVSPALAVTLAQLQPQRFAGLSAEAARAVAATEAAAAFADHFTRLGVQWLAAE